MENILLSVGMSLGKIAWILSSLSETSTQKVSRPEAAELGWSELIQLTIGSSSSFQTSSPSRLTISAMIAAC